MDRSKAARLPARARALKTVPTPDAGEARRRACRRTALVLRRPRPSRRRRSIRGVPRAPEEDALVRLRQAPVRRAEGRARLSLALHNRVAISNSRLIKTDATGVTFKVKNYRVEGRARYTIMTLDVGEFIRRVLIHVLPKGFHRIRHYGLFASGAKADDLTAARDLFGGSEFMGSNLIRRLPHGVDNRSCVLSR